MTLTNIFKAQAIFAWLWAVMFWFAPAMVAQGPGWELTADSIAFGQIVSVPMTALGVIMWIAPTWAADNLKKFGMLIGVYANVGFAAVQLFHVSSGVSKFDPLGMIPTVIFIALFLWKCRASD